VVKSGTTGILRQELRRDQSDRFGSVSPRGDPGEKIAPEEAVANAVAAINTQLNAPHLKPQPRSDSPRTAITPRPTATPRGVVAALSGESDGKGVGRAGMFEERGGAVDNLDHLATSYNNRSRFTSLEYTSHAREVDSSELESRLW